MEIRLKPYLLRAASLFLPGLAGGRDEEGHVPTHVQLEVHPEHDQHQRQRLVRDGQMPMKNSLANGNCGGCGACSFLAHKKPSFILARFLYFVLLLFLHLQRLDVCIECRPRDRKDNKPLAPQQIVVEPEPAESARQLFEQAAADRDDDEQEDDEEVQQADDEEARQRAQAMLADKIIPTLRRFMVQSKRLNNGNWRNVMRPHVVLAVIKCMRLLGRSALARDTPSPDTT